MFNKITAPIILGVISLISMMFCIISLPLLIGGFSLFCFIGCLVFLTSMILSIISVKRGIGSRVFKGFEISTFWSGLGLFVLPLLFFGCYILFNNLNSQLANKANINPVTIITDNVQPTASPSTGSSQTQSNVAIADNGQKITLTVVNPKDAPQPQVAHPSVYQETHVSATPVTFIMDVPENYIGIVGGYTIDGKSNGVYKAFGPGHYEFVITDGFGLITQKEWGKAEWDFRIGQAVQFKWAHENEDPGLLVTKTK